MLKTIGLSISLLTTISMADVNLSIKDKHIYLGSDYTVSETSKDWIAISKEGSSTAWRNVLHWSWVKDLSCSNYDSTGLDCNDDFPIPLALDNGNYEVRYFKNNSYTISASETFNIGNTLNLSAISTIYNSNKDSLTLKIDSNGKNFIPNPKDWIGIYKIGDSTSWSNVKKWIWANKLSQSKNPSYVWETLDLPEGKYEVSYFFNNSFKVFKKSEPFEIKKVSTPTPVPLTKEEVKQILIDVNNRKNDINFYYPKENRENFIKRIIELGYRPCRTEFNPSPYFEEGKWASIGIESSGICYSRGFSYYTKLPGGIYIGDSGKVAVGSPIVFDMNGDGKINTTGESTAQHRIGKTTLGKTIEFDLDGDGKKESIEWLSGIGDALLIDNINKKTANNINGNHLYGDQGGKFLNGYSKLQLKDLNHDDKISGDELNNFLLWFDNGNGKIENNEIKSLQEAGILEFGTKPHNIVNAKGETLIQSSATTISGKSILVEDVWFGINK